MFIFLLFVAPLFLGLGLNVTLHSALGEQGLLLWPLYSASRIETDKRVDSKILNELTNSACADENIDAWRNKVTQPGLHIWNTILELSYSQACAPNYYILLLKLDSWLVAMPMLSSL